MFCTLSKLDDIAGTWFARAGQRCQSFVRYEFLPELGLQRTCQSFVSSLRHSFVRGVLISTKLNELVLLSFYYYF